MIMEKQIQRYNVVCITKRRLRGTTEWHLPITGEAEVYAVTSKDAMGVDVTKTMVKFQGEEYVLLSTRLGLDRMAVVLCVYAYVHESWELYTDTIAPMAKGTLENLQESARRAIHIAQQRHA